MWRKTSFAIGVAICVFFASMAFGGVKSPFGAIFKSMASGGSGRSGYYYYGGGK